MSPGNVPELYHRDSTRSLFLRGNFPGRRSFFMTYDTGGRMFFLSDLTCGPYRNMQ